MNQSKPTTQSVGTLITHGKGGILSLNQDRRIYSFTFAPSPTST
jgi:hypothetical protein